MLWLWKAQCDTRRDLHLLCTNKHSLGGSNEAKASLGHTLGLSTKEDYFWIKALAHCQLWQNSHWSHHSQDFTSVAAIFTPCLFCLGTSTQHKKGLNSARSFCVMTCRQKSWNPSHKQPNTHQPFKKFKTLPSFRGFKPAYTSTAFHTGTPCWNILILLKCFLFFLFMKVLWQKIHVLIEHRARRKLNYILNTNLMQ